MTHLKKEDWEVRIVADHARVVAFISEHHYARGAGKVAVFRLGLFRKDTPEILRGAGVWLPPTSAAAKYVSNVFTSKPDNHKEVITLSRLAIEPEAPTNSASFFLAKMRKIIRSDGRYKYAVTYADSAQDHTGAIYLADNWTYDGESRPTPIWVDSEGAQVSVKSAGNTRTKTEMESLGYIFKGRSLKRRFLRKV